MKIKNKNGLTLTELIVASVIIGIVMLGVASIDLGIRSAVEGTTRNSIVASDALSAMQHIARTATQASGWAGNPGVVILGAGNSSLCFRVDSNLTPGNYADDNWRCYTLMGGDTLRFCGAAAPVLNCPDAINTGNLSSRIAAFTAAIVENPADGVSNFYVDVLIRTRFDTSAPADALDNPEYTLRSRINMPSHSSIVP